MFTVGGAGEQRIIVILQQIKENGSNSTLNKRGEKNPMGKTCIGVAQLCSFSLLCFVGSVNTIKAEQTFPMQKVISACT